MRKIIREVLPYIIVVLFVVLIRYFIITPIQVVGTSMTPTLDNGELMLLNKITYRFSSIDRFDIVVVNFPDKPLIKRIVGLPGEKIQYKDGDLYINGNLTKESFEKNGNTGDYELIQTGYQTIPKDMYFVVGDNRVNSSDSRTIGLIEKNEILGKANFVLFPLHEFGFVK